MTESSTSYTSPVPWHHLFGLLMTKAFENFPFEIHLEKDLSIQQQFLDILIITNDDPANIDRHALPDGLDNLSYHNLISYKSHQEAFDSWSANELIGHYVSYRKSVSKHSKDDCPEEHFSLYGICTRVPNKLAKSVPLQELQKGVYQIDLHTIDMRILVLSQMPQQQQNALWHVFSAKDAQVAYGLTQFPRYNPEWRSLLHRLYNIYKLEGFPMAYTMKDVMRDNALDSLHLLSPQEVVETFGVDNILKGLPPEKLLEVFSSETLVQHLPQDAVLPHMLEERRHNIVSLLNARLNLDEETITMIHERLEQIQDKERLHQLLLRAGTVETLEEFLLELPPTTKA